MQDGSHFVRRWRDCVVALSVVFLAVAACSRGSQGVEYTGDAEATEIYAAYAELLGVPAADVEVSSGSTVVDAEGPIGECVEEVEVAFPPLSQLQLLRSREFTACLSAQGVSLPVGAFLIDPASDGKLQVHTGSLKVSAEQELRFSDFVVACRTWLEDNL